MQRSQGVLLIEVLIALIIVGILAAYSVWRTDQGVGREARTIAAVLATRRASAVAGGGPVVDGACLDRDSAASLLHQAMLVSWPPRGLQFTPDGLPRTCDGGGVGNTTILLERRGRQAAVIVSSLGRVRWELR